MSQDIKIKLVQPGAHLPKYATDGSAGADLCAHLNESQIIKPGHRALIPAGIAIALPSGLEAQIRPRSGLAVKHGIGVLNSPGTIDSDYRGEIKIILINHGQEDFTVNPGMRIAQMVIAPYHAAKFKLVENLDSTDRGQGGFGSTGTL